MIAAVGVSFLKKSCCKTGNLGLKTLFSDSGKYCRHIFCRALVKTNAISKGLLERINVNFCMGLTPGINSPKGLGKNHLINGVGVTVGRDEFVDMEWPSVRATSETDHIILSLKFP